MSRLTFRGSKGELWIKDAADIDEQGQICMLTDRLAAYEDVGLEPEEIKDHEEMFAAYRHVCGGKSPEEIVHALELMEAERDGRLVVLPFKVGDTVYRVVSGFSVYTPHPVRYVTDERIKSTKRICEWIEGNDFGKTVFLTRAEAEEALERSRA